jgi:hypothetical protein
MFTWMKLFIYLNSRGLDQSLSIKYSNRHLKSSYRTLIFCNALQNRSASVHGRVVFVKIFDKIKKIIIKKYTFKILH